MGETNLKPLLRLQTFLSHQGVCSRRQAMDFIFEGKISVNGRTVQEPSFLVDPLKDQVCVDGKRVEVKQYEYVLLNKPAGFVTTMASFHREKNVMSLLPKRWQHLVPVGRLDKDTQGFLLLTNDGPIAYYLTHPQFAVDKVYQVTIDGILNNEEKNKLESGVQIKAETAQGLRSIKTAPTKINRLIHEGGKSFFEITIHEGKKRQIRLMLNAVGHQVIVLKRISQGPLQLGALEVGQYRVLTLDEIRLLRNLKELKKK